MNKKTLHIQTNFLDEEDSHAPIVTTSKINYQDKLQAATFLQKLLSIILAKNFIECWKQLKIYNPSEQKLQAYSLKLNNKQQISSGYLRQGKGNYFQSNVSSNSKLRSQSQAFRFMKSSHTSEINEEYVQPKRNKSVRVINQQLQNSRATVLKQIVEKLKNIRKVNNIQQPQPQNQQVLKKITHLQKMVRNIKYQSTNRKAQSRISRIRKSSTSQNASKSQNQQTRYNNIIQPKDDQDEIQRQLLKQILEMKKQIQQIRLNNEVILKNQLEKSRVSSNSSKNNKIEQAARKQTISEGVQTQTLINNTQISQKKSNKAVAIQYDNVEFEDRKNYKQKQITKIQIQKPQYISIQNNPQIQNNKYSKIEDNNYVNTYRQQNQKVFKKQKQQPKLSNKPQYNQQTQQYEQINNIKDNAKTSINNDSNINFMESKNKNLSFDNIQTSQIMKQFRKFSNILNQPLMNKSSPINSFPLTNLTNQGSGVRYIANAPLINGNSNGYQYNKNQTNGTNVYVQEQIIPPPIKLQSPQIVYQQPQYIPQQPPQQQLQGQQHIYQHQQPPPQFQYQIVNPLQQTQQIPSKNSVKFSHQPFTQIRPQQPRFDQVKTNTTFYSKNNVYSDVQSSSSFGMFNRQIGHYRNPSIQVQQIATNSNPNVNFTNYCSSCGRNCGCPRIINDGRRI